MLLSRSWRMRSLSTASRQISIPPRYAAYAMVIIMAISVNSYFDRVSEIEAEDREASGADSGEPVALSTTLWSEGFETVGNTADGGSRYALAASTASGASAIVESSDGSEDYVTRSDGSNIKSDNDVSSDGGGTWGAAVGSWSFGIHDQDGAPTPCDPCVLTWSGITISSYTSLEFSGYFAEDDDSSNQDWDAGDKLEVEVSIDSGSWTDIFMISGGYGGASTNAAPYTDTDFDGVGDGTEITDTWQSFTSSISGTGTSMDIRVVVSSLTQTDTDIWFDALQIVGTAASGDCAAGQYSSNGQAPCTPCPAGSFQPYTGKSWCTTAWGGQYATGTGNTGQTACAAGSYSPSSGGASACTPCEAGKYQDGGAKSYCTLAEGGQFASGTGNTGTTDCVAGEYSPTSGGASACTPCAAGTYQPSAGKSWCSSALGGQYVSGTGATSQTPCAAGSYSPSSGGATSCTAVPADNYQDQAGMSWYTACPSGTSTSGATGSDEASDCA